MTTVQALIDRVRRDYLTQGRVEARNRLKVAIGANDSTMTFQYELATISAATMLSIGLEDIYVWSVDPTSNSAEVDRGADSTTAASHTTNERVRVAPRWSDAQLLRSVNGELANLYAQGLYGVDTHDFSFTSATVGYELPAAAEQVLRVQARDYTGDDWIDLSGWTLRTAQSITDFPSGVALFMRQPGVEGMPVKVTYRRQFGSLSTLAQDVETVSKLPASALDVLAMGTAISVLVGREVANRLYEQQGSTRRADETPPGSVAQSFTPIIRQYQARLQAEKRALARRYGI